VVFYDWETGRLVRRIDISPKKLYWNDNNTKVTIATNEDFYILSHNA
jgi:coatomer subunit beta'